MNWFYAKNGSQQGPLSTDEIKSRIAMGEIGPDDLAWCEGMADWMPVGQISQLKVEAPVREDLPPPVGAAPSPYSAPSAPAGAPAPVVPGQAPSQGLAIGAMVCGILAFIGCCTGWLGGILALAAIVLGHIAISRAGRNPAANGGKGMARSGLVLGYLGLIGAIVFTALSLWLITLSPERLNELLQGMPEEQRRELIEKFEEARSRGQQR